MLDDFLIRALLGGLGVALAAGPLGCFVVWRRMAYFGDSLAHSALLGVAVGAVLNVDLRFGVLGVGLAIAIILAGLERRAQLATDTLLGILAHSALAFGFIAVSLVPGLRADVIGLLFGDVLAISKSDLAWIWGGAAIVLAVLAILWRKLLLMTIDADLARAEGVPTAALRVVLMLLIAISVALAMKAVGALLITALLLIPAATARRFARTPEGMAVRAAGIGAIAVVVGLGGSLSADLPAGPAIVAAAAVIFAAVQFRRSGDRLPLP
ncbi:MAG: metal ABC transporter permease [Dongiaceae bacterium]